MARLTQQKYDLTCALMKLGFEIHSGNEHLIFAAVDAYADAQVDAAVGRCMAEMGKSISRISSKHDIVVAAKDTKIAELKASLSNAQQMYTDLLVGTTDAIAAKDTEIKRLSDFANQCHKAPEKLVVIHYFENGEFDYCDLVPLQDAAANAISPAPVTDGNAHGEAITSKPKPRAPITALEAVAKLRAENEARQSMSETRLLHELFHQVGNSTWMAKGCSEITLESNGTWTLERIGKKGKKAIVINKSLWVCLQKAKAIIEKLNSPLNEDQE